MEKWELIAPCHFGLEAVLKREILDLGYEISKVEDGKVTFWGDAQAVADANVFIREPKICPGKITFQKMESSGWPRRTPSKVSCLVLLTFSLL